MAGGGCVGGRRRSDAALCMGGCGLPLFGCGRRANLSKLYFSRPPACGIALQKQPNSHFGKHPAPPIGCLLQGADLPPFVTKRWRNDDYLLVSCFSRSPACRTALRKERKDSYAPLHSVRNDKSCHPQEEVQTNSDTGIAPCIAPQTAEKKAVSDRFSAHLPENRKIIRNFVGQSINCRARI